MDTKARILELNKQKTAIEGSVGLINQQILQLQQKLAEHNRDFLIIRGKLEILNEMNVLEKVKVVE